MIRPCHLKEDRLAEYYLRAYGIWKHDPREYPASKQRPQFVEAMNLIESCVRFYEKEFSGGDSR